MAIWGQPLRLYELELVEQGPCALVIAPKGFRARNTILTILTVRLIFVVNVFPKFANLKVTVLHANQLVALPARIVFR